MGANLQHFPQVSPSTTSVVREYTSAPDSWTVSSHYGSAEGIGYGHDSLWRNYCSAEREDVLAHRGQDYYCKVKKSRR